MWTTSSSMTRPANSLPFVAQGTVAWKKFHFAKMDDSVSWDNKEWQ